MLADGLGLESSFRTLQGQLDNSNRRISTTETILRSITQERDSAISQLGVAYFTIEQLKVENEGLKDENNKLKTRLAQLSNDREDETQQWNTKEEALRRKLDRRTDTVRSIIEENKVQPSKLQNKAASKAGRVEDIEPTLESSTHKNPDTIFDLRPSRKDFNESFKGGQRTAQIDDSQDSEDSVHEAPTEKGKAKLNDRSPRGAENAQAEETSQNLTYLSFLEVKIHFILS